MNLFSILSMKTINRRRALFKLTNEIAAANDVFMDPWLLQRAKQICSVIFPNVD